MVFALVLVSAAIVIAILMTMRQRVPSGRRAAGHNGGPSWAFGHFGSAGSDGCDAGSADGGGGGCDGGGGGGGGGGD